MQPQKTISFVLVLFCVSVPSFAGEASHLEGVYRSCSMGCVEIELLQDHTFKLRLYGHLQHENVDGTWSEESEGVVVASTTPPSPLPDPRPIEAPETAHTVHVADPLGQPIPGAFVSVTCNGQAESASTNVNGEVIVSRCQAASMVLVVHLDGFRGHNLEVSAEPNGYSVVLALEQIEIVEERWLIIPDELHILQGDLLVGDPLVKVSLEETASTGQPINR